MAERRELGADVTALIHHVQLNESGWLDRAIGRAIKFLLWLYDEPLSLHRLVEYQAQAGLNHLTLINVSTVVDHLCEVGELIEIADQTYKLSEEERGCVDEAVSHAEKTESAVKNKLLSAASELGSGPIKMIPFGMNL